MHSEAVIQRGCYTAMLTDHTAAYGGLQLGCNTALERAFGGRGSPVEPWWMLGRRPRAYDNPVAFRMRRGNCAQCGEEVERNARTGKPLICPECGIANMAEAARQIAAKSGPYYERWRAGMATRRPPTPTPR